MLKELCQFLDEGSCAFLVVDQLKAKFKEAGFEELKEKGSFRLQKGKNYYLTRNDSSIIAFKVGKKLNHPHFQLAAAHGDCPSLKVKPNGLVKSQNYTKLNVEVYGGAILGSWFDRPLALSGRVIVEDAAGLKVRHLNYDHPFAIIPSVAVHLNPKINQGYAFNPQIDLMPFCALNGDFDLNAFLAKQLKVKSDKILNYDLFLHPYAKALIWGEEKELISANHLDDAASAFAAYKAFIDGNNDETVNVYCCFDNEEVGSLTRQGAFGDFLRWTLTKIATALKFDLAEALSASMMLSCDMGHAVHPNHPELSDAGNGPIINGGIVIKYNANQSYTSDALGSAIFTKILKKGNVPYQYYANRSDIRGGSTLGNISNAQVSLLSLDIGMAQLAMHSSMETMGTKDIGYMVEGIKAFYEADITFDDDMIKVQ